jgi:hypothetical protein
VVSPSSQPRRRHQPTAARRVASSRFQVAGAAPTWRARNHLASAGSDSPPGSRRAERGGQTGEGSAVDPPGGASKVMVPQEGIDGVLERDRAGRESHDLPHGVPSPWVSQQTRAARPSHATATAQVGPSTMGRCRSKSALCRRRSRSAASQCLRRSWTAGDWRAVTSAGNGRRPHQRGVMSGGFRCPALLRRCTGQRARVAHPVPSQRRVRAPAVSI